MSAEHPGPERFAVGVVIPARDEGDHIAETVSSVLRAIDRSPATQACIVVVADTCSDATAAVARRHLESPHLVVEVAHGRVGAARATGSLHALARLRSDPRRTWVLGIDGDSLAPPEWIERHLAHASNGVECVTGIVDLRLGAPSELRRTFARSYRLPPPGEAHSHVHGTNFGIRADTLLEAGNWPALSTAEDHALWNTVVAMGRTCVQDPTIVVATSARLIGRAPDGFAGDLAALAERAGRESVRLQPSETLALRQLSDGAALPRSQ